MATVKMYDAIGMILVVRWWVNLLVLALTLIMCSTAAFVSIRRIKKIDPAILTAAGRSEFVPIDPKDKAKNRRIEIILTPNLDKLFEILDDEASKIEKYEEYDDEESDDATSQPE